MKVTLSHLIGNWLFTLFSSFLEWLSTIEIMAETPCTCQKSVIKFRNQLLELLARLQHVDGCFSSLDGFSFKIVDHISLVLPNTFRNLAVCVAAVQVDVDSAVRPCRFLVFSHIAVAVSGHDHKRSGFSLLDIILTLQIFDMATGSTFSDLLEKPRENIPLIDESALPIRCGISGDPRRWAIFSQLPPSFAETLRSFYIFTGCKGIGSDALFVTCYDEVWALGTEFFECLGTGDDKPFNVPVKLAALTGKAIQSFAHGEGYVFALTRKGEVYAGGAREFVRVTSKTKRNSPLPLMYAPALLYDGDDPALEIACGFWHSAWRTEKGHVYCWGEGRSCDRALGVKQRPLRRVEGPIAKLKCTGISCSSSSTVAVFENGEVYTWECSGQNYGLRGIGPYERPRTLARVDFTNAVIKKVASGSYHHLALADDGSLYVWGSNNQAQLGLGQGQTQQNPIRHSDLRDSHGEIIEIAATKYTSAVMTDKRQVLMWGASKDGNVKAPTAVCCESVQDVFTQLVPDPTTPVTLIVHPMIMTSWMKGWGGNLLNTLNEQFDNPTYSDVKFIVKNETIHAHKIVLRFQSEYFRAMFEGPWEESQSGRIEVEDFSYPVYKTFLRYFYTGEGSLNATETVELFHLANFCGENRLKVICQKRIESSISIENCVNVYLAALMYDAKDLEDFCLKFAAVHLPAIARTSVLRALPDDIFRKFFEGAGESIARNR